jgi:hypothetical protein
MSEEETFSPLVEEIVWGMAEGILGRMTEELVEWGEKLVSSSFTHSVFISLNCEWSFESLNEDE